MNALASKARCSTNRPLIGDCRTDQELIPRAFRLANRTREFLEEGVLPIVLAHEDVSAECQGCPCSGFSVSV